MDHATAMVTAHLAGDEQAMDAAMDGLTLDDLTPLCGELVATVGNMVRLIAHGWECEPEEAWRVIQHARRETGAP